MKLLRGERGRDRVISPEEEQRYLMVAPEPLVSIVTILFDTGLRTDECFRLRWETFLGPTQITRSSAGNPNDATSPGHSRESLGRRWQA